MTLKTYTMAAIAGALATLATAQDAEIDVNGDGMYSYPELLAVMPDMSEENFTLMDADGDGLLNADEIAAGTEAGLLPVMDG